VDRRDVFVLAVAVGVIARVRAGDSVAAVIDAHDHAARLPDGDLRALAREYVAWQTRVGPRPAWVDATDAPPRRYDGPIAVDQRFVCMPESPRARLDVVVTRIQEREETGATERRIWTKRVDGVPATRGGDERERAAVDRWGVYNDEARFREACVPAEKVAP